MTEPTPDELARWARETAALLDDVTAGTHHDESPCTDVCVAASQACAALEDLATENERLLALVAAQAEQIADLQAWAEHWERVMVVVVDQAAEYVATFARVRALFAGGPDTPCRTVWQDGIECASVPLGDLRAALDGTEDPA